MKPLACLSVAAWMTMAALPPQALAHVGDQIIRIPELSDEDLALIDIDDGSIEDWERLLGEPILTPIDFFVYSGGAETTIDPSDLDFRLWMGWHRSSHRIYLGMECIDNLFIDDIADAIGSAFSNLNPLSPWP